MVIVPGLSIPYLITYHDYGINQYEGREQWKLENG